MKNFRRAEAVDIHLRETTFDVAEHFLVPIELEIWVQPALQQNLFAANVDGLLNFFEQHFSLQHITLRRLGRAIESAEVAHRRADVRVVDVPIDVVGAVGLGMHPAGHFIRRPAQRGQIVRLEQT